MLLMHPTQQKVEDVLITCLNCKGHSRIKIVNDTQVIYIDHTPIIACRLRGDMKWGFECLCGNDSRLAREEEADAPMLMQQGSAQALKALVSSLKVKDEDKFEMAAA
jgi:hypothetical protein